MNIQISELDITNFQRVSSARILPSNNLIVLAGQNANGKTSVLDAIQAAWCGHDSRTIKRPIKDGHGKAEINVTMTDGTVLTRKYTPSGTTLTAKGPDGVKLGQTDLNRMMSGLGVDASTFATSGDKGQLATLLSIVDLPFVPSELDAERKRVFDERANVGREGKAIGDVTVDDSLPTVETSASDIIAAIRSGEASNAIIATAKHSVDHWMAEIADLKESLARAERNLTDAEKNLTAAPVYVDTSELETQLTAVEDTNAAIRANNAAIVQARRKDGLRDKYTALTVELDAIDKRKADGLAAAVMPIEDLEFDEEGVLYKGVPFSRASGAEQIIVSAAMIIATNPELRTMVIRNGNVLDANSMQTLQDMGESADFQIFIEFVSDSTDHEFRLVDGELAS